MGIDKLRQVRYEFKECLVGQTVSCLMYAYLNDLPVIGIEKYKPLRFSYIDIDVDLSPLSIDNETRELKTIESRLNFVAGMEEIKLWHILRMHLSYAGLLPCFGMYETIDIQNEDLIILPVKNKNIEVYCENFVFYDSLNTPLYEVNDYININKNSNIPIDYHDNMEIDWPYFKEMYFYPTDRVAGKHTNKKDVCAKSMLCTDKLGSFEYSELSSRLKVEHFLTTQLDMKSSLEINRREVVPSFESYFTLSQILNHEMAYDLEKISLFKYCTDWLKIGSLKV